MVRSSIGDASSPNPRSGAHATGPPRAKGAAALGAPVLFCRLSDPVVASVSGGVLVVERTRHDRPEVVQAPRAGAHGQDRRELRRRPGPAPRRHGDHPRPGRGAGAVVLRRSDPGAHGHGLGGVVRAARPVGRRAARPHRDRPAGGRAPGDAHPRLGCPGGGDELRALAGCAPSASGAGPTGSSLRRRRPSARRPARSSGRSSTRAGEPAGSRASCWSSAASPSPSRPGSTSRTAGPACWSPSPRRHAAKATIAAEHSRLAGPQELEQQRAFWRAALVVLKDDLERRAPSAGGGR